MAIRLYETETSNICKRCSKTEKEQQIIGERLSFYKNKLLCNECIRDLKEMEE